MSESLSEFVDRLHELMQAVMRGMLSSERNALTRGVISVPQFWALTHVHDHPGCSMHALARALDLRLSSATGLADRLVRMDLVRRERATRDRRVVQVNLTAAGRRLLRQIHQQKRECASRIFAPLTEAERRDYIRILRKVVDAQAAERGRVS